MASSVPDPPLLSSDDERCLLALARLALERYVLDGELLETPPAGEPLPPRLLAPHAVFVSLHRGPRLRGCVGFSEPIKPLAHAVMENALNAAMRDFRFPPIEAAELDELMIEISVMSALCELLPADVMPGVHGLVIERGGHKGLLLPQVATEHRWDRECFLRQLCLKAGLMEDEWQPPGARLLGFTARVFSESVRAASSLPRAGGA